MASNLKFEIESELGWYDGFGAFLGRVWMIIADWRWQGESGREAEEDRVVVE